MSVYYSQISTPINIRGTTVHSIFSKSQPLVNFPVSSTTSPWHSSAGSKRTVEHDRRHTCYKSELPSVISLYYYTFYLCLNTAVRRLQAAIYTVDRGAGIGLHFWLHPCCVMMKVKQQWCNCSMKWHQIQELVHIHLQRSANCSLVIVLCNYNPIGPGQKWLMCE